MKTILVQYQVKAKKTGENKALIEDVFRALREEQPPGLRYAAFLLPDGQSFVHMAVTTEAVNPVTELPAFHAFTADLKERCDQGPQVSEMQVVGNYRLVSE
jgi:hypothetical protein